MSDAGYTTAGGTFTPSHSTTVYYIHPVKSQGLYDSTSASGRVREASEALEESRIVWGRDWDALASGFVIGVLMTLALLGLVGWVS